MNTLRTSVPSFEWIVDLTDIRSKLRLEVVGDILTDIQYEEYVTDLTQLSDQFSVVLAQVDSKKRNLMEPPEPPPPEREEKKIWSMSIWLFAVVISIVACISVALFVAIVVLCLRKGHWRKAESVQQLSKATVAVENYIYNQPVENTPPSLDITSRTQPDEPTYDEPIYDERLGTRVQDVPLWQEDR